MAAQCHRARALSSRIEITLPAAKRSKRFFFRCAFCNFEEFGSSNRDGQPLVSRAARSRFHRRNSDRPGRCRQWGIPHIELIPADRLPVQGKGPSTELRQMRRYFDGENIAVQNPSETAEFPDAKTIHSRTEKVPPPVRKSYRCRRFFPYKNPVHIRKGSSHLYFCKP